MSVCATPRYAYKLYCRSTSEENARRLNRNTMHALMNAVMFLSTLLDTWYSGTASCDCRGGSDEEEDKPPPRDCEPVEEEEDDGNNKEDKEQEEEEE
jgi:hypothetical protein